MKSPERCLFPKSYRLFLKKDVDGLFANGRSFIAYPLRVVYLADAAREQAQTGGIARTLGVSVLIGVPKKYVRRAVKRNRIKRIIRESFRLNKQQFTDELAQSGIRLHVALMYVCKEPLPYSDVEKAVVKALKTLTDEMRKKGNNEKIDNPDSPVAGILL